MATSMYEMDSTSLDRIASAIEEYGPKSTQIIKEELDKNASTEITTHIPGFIHASGRNWKGKAASATVASPTTMFNHDMQDALTLEIHSKGVYHYLYFPDDGSDTKRHIGGQEFMLRGAESVSSKISDDIVTRLAAAFMEG